MIDLVALRARPSGFPLLHQRWTRLVFLHWRLAPQAVRPRVPPELELDLFDGAAWVTLAAFHVSRMRPSLLPPLPGLSDAEQINVRTYVRRDGVPGLWFFSLDANNQLAVWAARLVYRLPWHRARMEAREIDGGAALRSERAEAGAPPATLDAEWRVGDVMPSPEAGTVDSFLLDRYILYAGAPPHLLRARIHHRRWPLRAAALTRFDATMLEASGLPTPVSAPLLHAQASPLDVDIWPPSANPLP
jgi:uncharacterized protein YqjF (DUF2071 family)